MLVGRTKKLKETVLRIKEGDPILLQNYSLDNTVLYGIFEAHSDGNMNIVPEAWNGKYPAQVRIRYKKKYLLRKYL
jgi:hypothetical protein